MAVATLALVALFGRIDPLGALSRHLTGDDSRLQPVREDPAHIDPRRGDDLLGWLRTFTPPAARRLVLVFGNSQQYTASLPRGEAPDPDRPVLMASARLAATLEERAPGKAHVYNAAAPNQNLAEALWQALYWLEVSPTPPAALILQLSFDTFRKTGIRPGYQTLLDEPAFASALDRLLDEPERPYHSELRAARKAHEERRAELEGKAEEQWSPEASLRDAMQHVELYRLRQERRASFFGALYAIRVRALGISPTTRRHVTGPPFEQSFAALEDLVRRARRRGASVMIYNAPSNPAVDMFFPDEYRHYLERLAELCRAESVPFADLAAAIPAERWGYWIDGPDPIHFDRHGHALLYERLVEAFLPALTAATAEAR